MEYGVKLNPEIFTGYINRIRGKGYFMIKHDHNGIRYSKKLFIRENIKFDYHVIKI
jgi:hypothetical protein